MRKIFLQIVSTLCLSLLISGCGPRGESKSVDEILATAKAQYAEAQKSLEGSVLQEQVNTTLSQLSDALDKLSTAQGSGGSQLAKSAEESLSSLVEKAGYTSRASMTELAHQYDALSEDLSKLGAGDVAGATARTKLLAARTYTVLASEISTTKFPFGRKEG